MSDKLSVFEVVKDEEKLSKLLIKLLSHEDGKAGFAVVYIRVIELLGLL